MPKRKRPVYHRPQQRC